MKKLICFEFRKLFRSKYFYIITAVSVLFVLLSGLTSKAISDAIIENGETVQPYSAYLFTKSALGGTYTLFVAIFVALFATEDSTSGTLKNIYAKGYTRNQVYFSKYLVSLISVLVISAVTVLFAYSYSYSIWGNDLKPTDHVFLIFVGQFLGIAAYHAIFFAISTTFGKVGSAIALNIIGPMAVALVLGLGDAFIKSENTKLTSFWVDSLFSNFTTSDSNQKMLGIGIVFFTVYIAAAILIGSLVNRKKEI
ncbi:MAG: ABC transporter permease [Clostridia bacterium]|nr:ABC transporter permease [Clostridia bacterium]